jgi:2-polyprenyl-6-methoxyphenol hydroxylase-like FAD-dependent oxidoreductase
MRSLRIVIVGAGIGGLTAALALLRRGFRPVVYERAPVPREIGAGVIIWPNARRALRDLEIDEALAAMSSDVRTSYFCDYATGSILDVRWGEQLVEQHGMCNLQVHRGDLHGLLLQAVLANNAEAVRPGHQFIRLAQDGDGVTVEFANGASVPCDVVVGADGNVSAVASAHAAALSAARRPDHESRCQRPVRLLGGGGLGNSCHERGVCRSLF